MHARDTSCPAIIADETLTHCRLWSQATELLIMPTAPVELERPAFERAKRQALDIVVVKHIARQKAGSQHPKDGDFAGFTKLFTT